MGFMTRLCLDVLDGLVKGVVLSILQHTFRFCANVWCLLLLTYMIANFDFLSLNNGALRVTSLELDRLVNPCNRVKKQFLVSSW